MRWQWATIRLLVKTWELALRMCVGFRWAWSAQCSLSFGGGVRNSTVKKRWQARRHLVDRPLKMRLMTSYSQIGFWDSNWIGQRELNVESTDHRALQSHVWVPDLPLTDLDFEHIFNSLWVSVFSFVKWGQNTTITCLVSLQGCFENQKRSM